MRENRSRRQHGIVSRENVSLDNMNNTNPTKTGRIRKCCLYSGTRRVYPVKNHETEKEDWIMTAIKGT